ncbi:redoxin domain-containing protein [uncultured Brevibacillus sp.]|uniref:TlpA family protein disulfide reductase n=1 Tax=uncultured Brevibacillus sp. TaxID=169970 RepID=UPI0025967387|nr:redoxin domain-containing protein [uncultured Brevibacillus sp.]
MDNGLMISNLLLWIALFIQSLILLFFIRLVVKFLNRFRISNMQVEAAILKIGEKAPYFREKDQNGKVIQVTQHLGKHTLLLFTNDTCGTCKVIIPDLPYVSSNSPDVTVIVVSNPIFYEKGLEMPTGISLIRSEDIMSKYYIQAVPTAVLIDNGGTIRAIKQVSAFQEIVEMLDMPADKVG